MDGFIYTCNGELDEQAFRRFTNKNQRIIKIYSNSQYFKESQITNIEGLENE